MGGTVSLMVEHEGKTHHVSCKSSSYEAVKQSVAEALALPDPVDFCFVNQEGRRLDSMEHAPPLLRVRLNLDPFERAQERAALTKVIFCPPDEVYHNAKGALVLESTASQPGLPEYFVGTRLCDRWSIERFIQAGSFGRGWVARDHKEGRDVFIKTFRCWSDRQYIPSNKAELKSAEATHERGIKKEIRTILRPGFPEVMSHPNLVQTFACYGSVVLPFGRKHEMFFVFSPDLCSGGELYEYLVNTEAPPYVRSFEEVSAKRIFSQVASAIAWMHKHGCYHRDLKLENLVVDDNFNVKVMDFGSMKWREDLEEKKDPKTGRTTIGTRTTDVGTPLYQPEEMYRLREQSRNPIYDPAPYDVWSVGVILFFLVAGGVLFDLMGPSCFYFFQKINMKERGFTNFLTLSRDAQGVPRNFGLWEFFHVTGKNKFKPSAPLKNLLNRIFDLAPHSRIKIQDIVLHEWLQFPDTPQDRLVFHDDMRSRLTKSRRDRTFVLSGVATAEDALKFLMAKMPEPSELHMSVTPSTGQIEDPDSDGEESGAAAAAATAASAAAPKREAWITRDQDCLLVGSPTHYIIRISATTKTSVTATAHWEKGTLGQWLNFVLILSKNLGLEKN